MPPSTRLTAEDISPTDAKRLQRELKKAETVSVGNVTIEMTTHARAVLNDILDALAAGQPVEVTPVAEMLSTQEAADLLRVSRPTLIKLLDQGLLPFEQPGIHRRVPRAAVEEFLASRKHRRRVALDALAETHEAEGPDRAMETR